MDAADRPATRRSSDHSGAQISVDRPPVAPIAPGLPVRPVGAIAVGLVGACANAVLVQYVGYYLLGSHLGVDYLPIGVLCLFVLLIAANTVLRHVGLGLRRTELVVAYAIMLATSAIGESGFASRLIPSLVSVFYFASTANDWGPIFHHYIPDWAAPRDLEAIRMFYDGANGEPIPWGAWVVPLATWIVPTVGMVCLMFALGILLRRRWLERERLTFPLVQVPLALLGEEDVPGFNRALRRDGVFWFAFVVPVVLRTLQALHFHYPAVPFIKLIDMVSINELMHDTSFYGLFNTTNVEIHLGLIGIAILMRSEVSASFWVFEWFYLGVGAIIYLAGFGEGAYGNTPRETFGYLMFIYYSRLGGTLVAATMLLWVAREQIVRAWNLAWNPLAAVGADDRLLRWAFPLLAAGTALYFGWARVAGMATGAASIMLVVYVAAVIVLARIIADGGLFWASLSLDPMRTTVRFLGTTDMSGQTLTLMAQVNQTPMAHRGNILPSIMDSFQFGSRTGVSAARLARAMAIGVVVTGLFSLVSLLWIVYRYGALDLDTGIFQSVATFPYSEPAKYMTDAGPTNRAAIATTIGGGALMAMFIYLHRHYHWWPVYPLGFAIAESVTIEHLWFSVFIGWAIHVLIVRVWGSVGYRRIKPAAIGLVVGDFLAIGAWAVADILTGTVGNRLTHEVSAW